MRYLIFLFVLLLSTQVSAQTKTLYDFSALTIEGETYNFSSLKGKKVLIVNTASRCMLAPQFEMLQEVYEKYGGENFEIIAFPANNFRNQEPGTNDEIAAFCKNNYGITFQMMAKISVKGNDIHPLYKWLTSKDENGVMNASVKWNYQKFMIDEKGQLVGYLHPVTGPNSKKLKKWLTE